MESTSTNGHGPTRRRRALLTSLAAVSAALAAATAMYLMPESPSNDDSGEGGGQEAAQSGPASSEPSSGEPPATPEDGEPAAMTCYVTMDGVRYHAEPNAMSVAYGLAGEGQAFVVDEYVESGGTRWGLGDLKGAREDVYIEAESLAC